MPIRSRSDRVEAKIVHNTASDSESTVLNVKSGWNIHSPTRRGKRGVLVGIIIYNARTLSSTIKILEIESDIKVGYNQFKWNRKKILTVP